MALKRGKNTNENTNDCANDCANESNESTNEYTIFETRTNTRSSKRERLCERLCDLQNTNDCANECTTFIPRRCQTPSPSRSSHILRSSKFCSSRFLGSLYWSGFFSGMKRFL